MLAAKTYDDAAKILEECGFEKLSGRGTSALESAIASYRTAAVQELLELAPNKHIIDAFRIKYDYHNAKTIVKAEAAGASTAGILSDAGRIPPELLSSAFYKGEREDDSIPEILYSAMADAQDTLARTSDPQLSDFVLDRASFSELGQITEKSKSGFLSDYVRLSIDSANLRTAVRALRMKKDAGFLETVLADGGNVKAEDIILAVGAESSMARLFGDHLANAAKAGDEAVQGGRLTEFEKLCDNALTEYISDAAYISFGESVVICYLYAVENQLSSARIIMTGRAAGLEPEIIRERLRDTNV